MTKVTIARTVFEEEVGEGFGGGGAGTETKVVSFNELGEYLAQTASTTEVREGNIVKNTGYTEWRIVESKMCRGDFTHRFLPIPGDIRNLKVTGGENE